MTNISIKFSCITMKFIALLCTYPLCEFSFWKIITIIHKIESLIMGTYTTVELFGSFLLGGQFVMQLIEHSIMVFIQFCIITRAYGEKKNNSVYKYIPRFPLVEPNLYPWLNLYLWDKFRFYLGNLIMSLYFLQIYFSKKLYWIFWYIILIINFVWVTPGL